MFTRSTVRPASESRCGHVGARIERDETGIRRVWPGRCSRMSNTPWPEGSTPVRNDGHAAHECDGSTERATPRLPRPASAARFGRSPARSSGSSTSQSAPSQPTTSTRFDMGGQDTGAGADEAPAAAGLPSSSHERPPRIGGGRGRPPGRRRRAARRPRRPPRHAALRLRRGHAEGAGPGLSRRPAGVPRRRPGGLRLQGAGDGGRAAGARRGGAGDGRRLGG